MRLVTRESVERYLATDPVAALGDALAQPDDRQLTCQKWLDQSAPKRMVFEWLYGDLLRANRMLRVLDVGGGLTSFTRELARRHDYVLLDFLAHDTEATVGLFRSSLEGGRLQRMDWFDYHPSAPFDAVIANDLFPNVDQRLTLFLERFLDYAREIRMSLTYYDSPRFYRARRIDADEQLCMLAWDGQQTRTALESFRERICNPDMELFTAQNESVYPNGRQVCLVRLTGRSQGAS